VDLAEKRPTEVKNEGEGKRAYNFFYRQNFEKCKDWRLG